MKKLTLGLLALGLFPLFLLILMGGGESQAAETSTALNSVPAEYVDAVQEAGTQCAEVTPAIIAAQIQVESAWDTQAVSNKGAQGLAQFMPATWNQYGRDGDGDGQADPFNPYDAIASQGHYMCVLVDLVEDRFGERDIDLALAAYNTGLGNIGADKSLSNQVQTYVDKIKSLATATVAVAPGNIQPAIQWAQQQIGKPYRGHFASPRCGSFGPDCYDCCGLVKGAFEQLGINLPMSNPGAPGNMTRCEYAIFARASEYGGVRVPATLDSLQPGDILFFQSKGVNPAYDKYTHVAIYLGNGELVDATPSYGVSIRQLSFYKYDVLQPEAVRIVSNG